MHPFRNKNLILYALYMFESQEFILTKKTVRRWMVCFTYVRLSSLVGRRMCSYPWSWACGFETFWSHQRIKIWIKKYSIFFLIWHIYNCNAWCKQYSKILFLSWDIKAQGCDGSESVTVCSLIYGLVHIVAGVIILRNDFVTQELYFSISCLQQSAIHEHRYFPSLCTWVPPLV